MVSARTAGGAEDHVSLLLLSMKGIAIEPVPSVRTGSAQRILLWEACKSETKVLGQSQGARSYVCCQFTRQGHNRMPTTVIVRDITSSIDRLS